jgi:hypothetical protein
VRPRTQASGKGQERFQHRRPSRMVALCGNGAALGACRLRRCERTGRLGDPSFPNAARATFAIDGPSHPRLALGACGRHIAVRTLLRPVSDELVARVLGTGWLKAVTASLERSRRIAVHKEAGLEIIEEVVQLTPISPENPLRSANAAGPRKLSKTDLVDSRGYEPLEMGQDGPQQPCNPLIRVTLGLV